MVYRVEKGKFGVSRYRVEKGKCGGRFGISNVPGSSFY